jgi:hypothetical protein
LKGFILSLEITHQYLFKLRCKMQFLDKNESFKEFVTFKINHNTNKFFLLFVVWILHNVCIHYVKRFLLSLQYFEKVLVSDFVVFFCFIFVLLFLHLSTWFFIL